MGNTLTPFIPSMFAGMQIVAREQTGLIGACYKNSSAELVALNQSIVYPVASARSAMDITAAVNAPDTGDETVGNGSMTITKARGVAIRWTGEEQKGIQSSGIFGDLRANQFAQAIRTLNNEVEADLAALSKQFSRAYGTAGTAPFGTAGDLSDLAQVKKILLDNGVAEGPDLRLVMDTTAGASLEGKQPSLFKVNEAGESALLREGIINRLQGFGLGKSAAILPRTKGTGAGYLVNNVAGYAVGATTIAADTGAGTILAGDVVTFTGDTNKYLVTTALAGGSFTIAAPGLRQALADNVAITVGNSYTPNMAFDKYAVHLLTRAPALPVDESGKPVDAATDIYYISDPITGLTYQVTMYSQFRQVLYLVGLAWGVACVNPYRTAVLLG
jgi:hypothetical protein